jgi:hypothetical protein
VKSVAYCSQLKQRVDPKAAKTGKIDPHRPGVIFSTGFWKEIRRVKFKYEEIKENYSSGSVGYAVPDNQ